MAKNDTGLQWDHTNKLVYIWGEDWDHKSLAQTLSAAEVSGKYRCVFSYPPENDTTDSDQ